MPKKGHVIGNPDELDVPLNVQDHLVQMAEDYLARHPDPQAPSGQEGTSHRAGTIRTRQADTLPLPHRWMVAVLLTGMILAACSTPPTAEPDAPTTIPTTTTTDPTTTTISTTTAATTTTRPPTTITAPTTTATTTVTIPTTTTTIATTTTTTTLPPTTTTITNVPADPVEGVWKGDVPDVLDVYLPEGLYSFISETRCEGEFDVRLYPLDDEQEDEWLADEFGSFFRAEDMRAAEVARLAGGHYLLAVEEVGCPWTVWYERRVPTE